MVQSSDQSMDDTIREMRIDAARRSRGVAGPLSALVGALVVGFMASSGYLATGDLILNIFFLSGLALSPVINRFPQYNTLHASYVSVSGFILFMYSALASNGAFSSGIPILVVLHFTTGIYLGRKALGAATVVLLIFAAALVAKLLWFPSATELAFGAAQAYGRIFVLVAAIISAHLIGGRYLSEHLALLEKLKSATDHKSTFLANMSHEIRTPLNGILGIAQVMQTQKLSPDARGMVQTILDSGQSLTTILNDVLDLSKIEAGKVEINPEPADLRGALAQLLALWRPTAEEKNIALSLKLDEALPAQLSFDSLRVRQCVTNFVSNALKFTPRGSVTITASLNTQPPAPELHIAVADDGPGMSAEFLDNLFKPFEQADVSTTRDFGGTGLGLSISHRLAALMGGRIEVSSVLDQGSTFTLIIPAIEAENSAGDTAGGDKPDDADLTGRHILLVDDVTTNRLVAKLFLEGAGAQVTEATNGLEAFNAMSEGPFDLVLMDWHMPVLDGPSATAMIRSAGADWSNIPILALTADVMSADRGPVIACGMNGIVPKPIDRATLLSTIHSTWTKHARAA
jgi:signal transduction histidine kinase